MACSFARTLTMLLGVLWASSMQLASAQSSAQSTATIFVPPPGGDKIFEILIAAVIDSDPTATTYLVGCPQPTACDRYDFDFDGPCDLLFTVTQGPSSVRQIVTAYLYNEVTATETADCELHSTTSANCVFSEDIQHDGETVTWSTTKSYGKAGFAAMLRSIPLVTNTNQIFSRDRWFTDMPLTAAEPTSTTQILAASAVSVPSASSSFAVVTSMSHAGVPQIACQAGWAVGGMAAAAILGGL